MTSKERAFMVAELIAAFPNMETAVLVEQIEIAISEAVRQERQEIVRRFLTYHHPVSRFFARSVLNGTTPQREAAKENGMRHKGVMQ